MKRLVLAVPLLAALPYLAQAAAPAAVTLGAVELQVGPAGAAPAIDESGVWAAHDRGDLARLHQEIAVVQRLHPEWRPPAKIQAMVDPRPTALPPPPTTAAAKPPPHPAATPRRPVVAVAPQKPVAKAAPPTRETALACAASGAGTNEPSACAGAAARQPDLAADAVVAEAARRKREAGAAVMAGWQAYTAGRDDDARIWFQRAMDAHPGPQAAEGLAMANVRLGRLDEAERLAEYWSARQPAIAPTMARVQNTLRAQRLAAALKAGDTAQVMRATAATDDPRLLTLRGWALLRLDRPAEAQATFAAVAAAERGGATPDQHREVEYGHALASARLGILDPARRLLAANTLSPDDRRPLERAVLAQDVADSFDANQWHRTLALIDELQRRYGGERPKALEAWSLYHLRRFAEADALFATLAEADTSDDVARARAAIARRPVR